MILAGDAGERERFLRVLEGPSVLARTVASLEELGSVVAEQPCDLLLVRDEDGDGEAALSLARSATEPPDVVVLAPREDSEARVGWLAAGALGVLPVGLDDALLHEAILALVERRRRVVQAPLVQVPDEAFTLSDYVTRSQRMRDFLADARRVAGRDTTLLLLGETGTGKGLLARSIHNEGPRARQPFVAVNCGSLSETLLESELFGHEKGAFTGAIRGHRGHFELAHGGTLFLDEVSELPPALQVKLLRVLEDRLVQPLGSERSFRVDVRLVAATNRSLAEEVREGRFRRDLYYRLNVVTLELPPLRERLEDIPELAQSYVEHFRARFGAVARRLSDEAAEALCRHDWPGNIRELVNTMERAVLFASAPVIGLADLPAELRAGGEPAAPAVAALAPDHWLARPWREVRERVMAEAERRYLEGLLAATGGRVGEMAKRAGMDPRSLFEKLRRHGLRKEDFRE